MNNLELARLSVFNLELRKGRARNNIKYHTKQLEECIKRDINEESRQRIEKLLIEEENLFLSKKKRREFINKIRKPRKNLKNEYG